MDLRPVFYTAGLLLVILAAGMILPLLADFVRLDPEWKIFFMCAALTAFFGGLLILTSSGPRGKITPHQGFVMILACWLIPALCAALPFWLGPLHLSFTDAFFESVSGLTTTGTTILATPDTAPAGLLLWRAMLQWLGGIGMIVMALSLLPALKIGGMQMFQTGLPENERALARIIRLGAPIIVIYSVLTLLCLLFYHLAGLGMFDALAYAMGTVSTGGFATYADSLAHFYSSGPPAVAMVFMVLGALPFIVYLKMARGDLLAPAKDSQVRWFFGIAGGSTLLLTAWLMTRQNGAAGASLFDALFHTISILSGTGYADAHDGLRTRAFPAGLLFLLLGIGGCAGSAASGVKIFRVRVLLGVISAQMKKILYPHGVFTPRYNGKPVPDSVPPALMGFFFLYVLTIVFLATALSFAGLDAGTALSEAASALANVASGLSGMTAPVAHDAMPEGAKWILVLGMILGRLELLPVMILLTRSFWRR